MEFLVIENGVIANIIVCDNEETAGEFGAVPFYESARIGDEYDPTGIKSLNKRMEERITEQEAKQLRTDTALAELSILIANTIALSAE